jgi:hypothetical protein
MSEQLAIQSIVAEFRTRFENTIRSLKKLGCSDDFIAFKLYKALEAVEIKLKVE